MLHITNVCCMYSTIINYTRTLKSICKLRNLCPPNLEGRHLLSSNVNRQEHCLKDTALQILQEFCVPNFIFIDLLKAFAPQYLTDFGSEVTNVNILRAFLRQQVHLRHVTAKPSASHQQPNQHTLYQATEYSLFQYFYAVISDANVINFPTAVTS